MQTRTMNTTSWFPVVIVAIFIMALNACGSGDDSSPLGQNNNDSTAIHFQLQFKPNTDQDGQYLARQALAEPNICNDYLVQDIQVEVYRSSNDALEASEERNCGAHDMTIQNVPADVDLYVICKGYVAQQVCWQGRADGIVANADQNTDIGTIAMTYICDDQTPPGIETSLPGTITDASINTTISIRFNEPLAPSTISDQTILLTHEDTTVAGEVGYDPATYTISFTPQQDLEQYKTYSYSLAATEADHVTDTAGLALIGTFNWQFTTGIEVNEPPTASINTPSDKSKYALGAMIEFDGSGDDVEDGSLDGDSLVWSSDLNNRIGTGSSFSTDQLSEGTHIITLTASDSKGATGTDSISITVASSDIDPPSVPANLAIDSIAEGLIIAWDASIDNVGVTGYRIYRGDTLIASTSEMHYTDYPLTGGVSYCFRVSAYDAAGNESTKSEEICGIPLFPPR